MEKKTIKAWVHCKSIMPVCWGWWCFPFLNVKMTGKTKTPSGSIRAVKRTIERLGFKADIKIFWPKF